jgi:hypothetical protein
VPNTEATTPPAGCDRCERLENERALLELLVRNGETPGIEFATAPQCNVEVEDAGAPALARPPAEVAFDCLQLLQHLCGVQAAFDQGSRIGEFASSRPDGFAEDDWRGVEQAKLLVEPGDRRRHDLRRAAVTPVSTIRADRDGVEVGHGAALSLRAQ